MGGVSWWELLEAIIFLIFGLNLFYGRFVSLRVPKIFPQGLNCALLFWLKSTNFLNPSLTAPNWFSKNLVHCCCSILCRINLLAVLAAAKDPTHLGTPRLSNASMYKKKKRKKRKKRVKENKAGTRPIVANWARVCCVWEGVSACMGRGRTLITFSRL